MPVIWGRKDASVGCELDFARDMIPILFSTLSPIFIIVDNACVVPTNFSRSNDIRRDMACRVRGVGKGIDFEGGFP
jgi:hypothetical protein